jgi:nucleotide-binding universal stress UspA family protein
MYKHILSPTDGSPLSETAAHCAINLAKVHNARVTFFYATPEYQERWPVEGVSYTGPTREQFEEYARKDAERALAGLTRLAKEQGVSAEGHWTFTNHPYEGIIETAKARGCDLIVMGSHGRSGMKALVLGSETNKVLTHCHIPVLVCR